MPRSYNKIMDTLQKGVEERVFPGAVILVGHRGEVVLCEEVGHLSIVPEKLPMKKNTIFDVASLTKPLATTLAVMKMVDSGTIDLDQPLAGLLVAPDLRDKRDLTPRFLLTHSAGLVDWKPFYLKLVDNPMGERKRLLREWIIDEPFAYEPKKGSLYSDLGFMLIDWVIEGKAGESMPDFVQQHFYGPLGLAKTLFVSVGEDKNPPQSTFTKGGGGQRDWRFGKAEFAATEDCPWRKKVLQGEVHDDNAWALGGYCGHAGLFSTAEEIYIIANMLREHYRGERMDFFRPETVREFFTRQNVVERSDWGLGWDTRALLGSSAGKYFSRDSVGHTGFTGTSIWMDLVKDVIVIFLSNRIHPKRDNDKIKQFRPVLHDAVMEELGLASV